MVDLYEWTVIIFRDDKYFKLPFTGHLPIRMPLDREGQPVSHFGVSHVDAATELDSYEKGYLLFCSCQDQSSPNQVYHLGSMVRGATYLTSYDEFVFGSSGHKVNGIDAAWFN